MRPEEIEIGATYRGKNGVLRTVTGYGSSEDYLIWGWTADRLPYGGFTGSTKVTDRKAFAKWAVEPVVQRFDWVRTRAREIAGDHFDRCDGTALLAPLKITRDDYIERAYHTHIEAAETDWKVSSLSKIPGSLT